METMNLEKLGWIYGRRSIRQFRPGEIGEETTRELLKAAMAAPSAAGKDPWRFVVIRNPLMLNKIADVLPYGQMLRTATLAFAVCGDLSAAHDGQLSYLLQDCSAAIENLLLAAHAMGLGACWLGVHPRENRIQEIRALLSLPEGIVPMSVVAVGWPAEEKRPRTRYDSRYVYWEQWGQGSTTPTGK